MSHTEPPSAAPEEPQRPLNRTITPVAGGWDLSKKGKAIALLGLLIGCGAFAAVSWRREPAPPDPPDRPAQQIVPFEAVRAKPSTLPPQGATSASPDRPSQHTSVSSELIGGVPAPTPPGQPAPPRQAASAAPMLVYAKTAATSPSPGRLAPTPPDQPPTELETLRRGSRIVRFQASRLSDPNLVLPAGSLVPCVLETAVDSSTPGHVSCVIPADIYSANGAVVLLEKGARVFGEHRAGLRQGQRRLFVLWNRALTPAGVQIDLASPGTDALGAAGIDGDLDSHFWERFGGAVLMSVLDGALAKASDTDWGGRGLLREPSDAAAIALQNSINIPASLRKPPGEEVAIFTAADLDFSSVYELRAR